MENKRKCNACNATMNEGFVIDNGAEHYCSTECLQTIMTIEDFEKLYDDGEGDSYWTEWDDDEDSNIE